jgi:predicted transposase YbfD/YdcC
VAVLGVVVVATLAGAANYREMGSMAADLPQSLLALLGARWCPARRRRVAPSAGTLRRVLIALDADALDRAWGAWLREHADCDERGWAIALDGKDLRGSWDAGGRLVLFSAMTHRRHGPEGGIIGAPVTLGQIAVPQGTTETTQVRTLLQGIDIAGALVTADAAHTCVETARFLVQEAGADYLLTVKGNRSALHAAALAAGRALIAAEPEHVVEESQHGRISRWTTWSTDLTPDHGIELPYARRLAVIRRDIADLAGQPLSKEIALVLTSRASLSAAGISNHTRGHWGIENLEHRARDTVWHEDDHQAYIGTGARTAATFRNLALGIFAINGLTKIKETVQWIGRDPRRALPLITQCHSRKSERRL